MWFWQKENLSQPLDGLNIYLKCIENKQSLHMLQDFISKEFLRLRILKILKRTYFTFHLASPKAQRRRCACSLVCSWRRSKAVRPAPVSVNEVSIHSSLWQWFPVYLPVLVLVISVCAEKEGRSVQLFSNKFL